MTPNGKRWWDDHIIVIAGGLILTAFGIATPIVLGAINGKIDSHAIYDANHYETIDSHNKDMQKHDRDIDRLEGYLIRIEDKVDTLTKGG